MTGLNANQRNNYYLDEASRTGIHKSILAALYAVHRRPNLGDGEVGLGIAPANRIPLDRVNAFPDQVQFAANTIRSITDKLTAQGWKGLDIWDLQQGRYSDRFMRTIANGYVPPPSDPVAARLESTDYENLRQSYLEDFNQDCKTASLSQNLQFLDPALLKFLERLPRYYMGLSYQREALLEASRIWHKLNSREAAIASLLNVTENSTLLTKLDETNLDKLLVQFIQQIPPFYSSYPHQREALLHLVQLWRQLNSREGAIASLQNNASAEVNIQIIDPALVAFVQRIPPNYQRKGDQRNALTETFRLWRGLETRTIALKELGVDPQVLTASNPNRDALVNAATQLDRALVDFIQHIPINYQETEQQREALILLVQLWQGLEGRDRAMQLLLDDLRRMEQARPDSPGAFPKPESAPVLPRPGRWQPDNLQMHAAIVPNGNLTWAEATQGGLYLPPNQTTVEAIARIAELAQQATSYIGRPLRTAIWYHPAGLFSEDEHLLSQPQSRHPIGDAIAFYCDGLTGNQIYHTLDPWWSGGLGRYTRYPELCYIDAHTNRARWTQ